MLSRSDFRVKRCNPEAASCTLLISLSPPRGRNFSFFSHFFAFSKNPGLPLAAQSTHPAISGAEAAAAATQRMRPDRLARRLKIFSIICD
jgi:hypothetical protein